jgi:hypothetical protein
LRRDDFWGLPGEGEVNAAATLDAACQTRLLGNTCWLPKVGSPPRAFPGERTSRRFETVFDAARSNPETKRA